LAKPQRFLADAQARREVTVAKQAEIEAAIAALPPPQDIANVHAHSNNRKGHYSYYACHRRRTAGTCTNTLRMPIEEMNAAVLEEVEAHALTPEAIESVIHLSERTDVADTRAALDKERVDITKRTSRPVAAIETGGEMSALIGKLRELEARQRAIDTEIRTSQPIPRLAPVVVESWLPEWRRLLRATPTQARSVLQRILRGRLTFVPRADGTGYDFSGETRFDKLFTGLVVSPATVATPYADLIRDRGRGTESIGPDDLTDADYGRLLDAAVMRKGWRARQDSNLRPPA
jgi:recombinase-like zinc beta ribbon protein